MATTRIERETTVIYNDEEKDALIWTNSPNVMRRLDKLVSACPESYRCVRVEGNGFAKRYAVPKKLIRFARPVVRTEARREAAKANAERLAKYREEHS